MGKRIGKLENGTVMSRRLLLPALLVLATLGSTRAEIRGFAPKSGDALSSGTNAFTSAKLKTGYRSFRARVDLSSYERYGNTSPAWDDDVRAILAKYDEILEVVASGDVLKQILQDCDKAIAKGCTDPMPLFLKGHMMYCLGEDRSKAEPVLKDALQAMEASRYPALYKALTARTLFRNYQAQGREYEAAWLRPTLWKYLGIEAADPIYANGCQRYYMILFWDEWTGAAQEFRDFEICWREVEKNPTVDPWIKYTLEGRWHVGKAWQARGGGWGWEVTETGWEDFRAELKEAENCLTKAYELHPEYPEPAAQMIYVAMGKGSASIAEQRHWFDRAVAAQFDYQPAYRNLLFALRPRWHGSHEAMLKFGEECLNTERFDTAVPWFYLSTVWQIGSELKDWKAAYRHPGVYENLCRHHEGKMAQLQDPADRYYWQSVMVFFSWAAERYEEAAKLLDELGDHFDSRVPTAHKVSPATMIQEIRSRAAPVEDETEKERAI